MLLGITYFALLFWHSANTLDSWAYLWATLAVWLASWLARVFWKTRPLNVHNSHWFGGDIATVSAVPGDATRVDIWPSGEFHWKPSQHVFLRFTDIAPLENHPFTIATAESTGGSPRHLIFLLRAHAGFTRKLTSYARTHASMDSKEVSTSVWLDGPYGGLPHRLHNRYHTLILLAGGTGITACFPWLQEVITRAREEESGSKIKRVVLVWAMKRPDPVQWLADEFDNLAEAKKIASQVELGIRVHITGGDPLMDDGTFTQYSKATAEGEKQDELSVNVSPVDNESAPSSPLSHVIALGATVHSGRPVIRNVLQDFVRQGERTMVIGSGPHTFRADLGNVVAAAQSRVLKGEIVELALHLETFGW
jgi:predicted ferric reductase